MKIGILTFHRARNYGAILQCYALYSFLKSHNEKVEVIDYYPTYFKIEYGLFPMQLFHNARFIGKIAIVFFSILFFPIKLVIKNKFNNFLKLINLSKTYDNNIESIEGYDLIFFGSDQIWNKKLTYGQDDIFTGNFPHSHTVLATYAVSTEFDSSIGELNNYYKKILQNFDFVSAREKRLSEYFNSIIEKKSIWVLDPIFLIRKDQWERLAIKPNESKYLLVYTVQTDPKVIEYANIIASMKKIKIIEISAGVHYSFNKRRSIQTAGPREFLGYILNADYVLTTSFHGTAFSVKLEKQFCTLMLGRNVDERSKDLLWNIGLDKRLISINNLSIPRENIDYKFINLTIDRLISSSSSYINDIINNSSNR